MPIRATKPTSIKQALARISDHFASCDDDYSHLSSLEIEEMFIEFAMAVHYIAAENRIHPQRNYCLWLADQLYSSFPAVSSYDEDGNWVGPVNEAV